jgi:DNA polymerase-3 subunit delta'
MPAASAPRAAGSARATIPITAACARKRWKTRWPTRAKTAREAKKSAKSKTPSKDIKIEQIRNLADFMNISTHRQGLRVVVLYPAEALNTPASNALLKTLEEPPPGTLFLLASNSLDRLLPTILSRCRKFALPMPSHEQALTWLKAQA